MIGSVLACDKDSGPSFLNAGIGLRDESRPPQKLVRTAMNENQLPLFLGLLPILTPLPNSMPLLLFRLMQ
jgi:hypothetical protein